MKETLTRISIIVIVILFVVTGLGVGVYGFWQATHPAKPDTCTGGTESNVKSLPTPKIYKSSDKVTKLQKVDLENGSGPATKAGDCLVVKYHGSLASTGKVFDQNFDSNDGFKFKLGAGQVIPGWDQGLMGMKAGSTRRLVVPASLAYGSQGQGPIPANADLVFVVKLVSIK